MQADRCGDDGGTCTVTFTSPTAGTVTGHASVTFNVSGISLTRATGTGTLNASCPASAGLRAPTRSSTSSPALSAGEGVRGALQGGATFELCRTNNYILPVRHRWPIRSSAGSASPSSTTSGTLATRATTRIRTPGEFLVWARARAVHRHRDAIAPRVRARPVKYRRVDPGRAKIEPDDHGPVREQPADPEDHGFGYTNLPDGPRPYGITGYRDIQGRAAQLRPGGGNPRGELRSGGAPTSRATGGVRSTWREQRSPWGATAPGTR